MLEAKEYAKIFADRIAKGAFLTTCDGQKSDTMTIGWGSVGCGPSRRLRSWSVRPV
jgi:hypothetical protein